MITIHDPQGSLTAILLAMILLMMIAIGWGLVMALCVYGWRRTFDQWHTKKPAR